MKKGDRTGWSLVEIAIVVTIIGILAALAIPMFMILTKRSRISTLANDFRIHSQAILRYAMEEDVFPSDFDHTNIPKDAEGYPVVGASWKEPSPVGGFFSWEFNNAGDPNASNGFIQIKETAQHPLNVELSDIRKLDDRLDDGNLSTGVLQMAGTRIRYYVKLPNP